MTAIATRTTTPPAPIALIKQYQADFATVLPSHINASTWCRMAVAAVKRNPKLEEAARNDPGRFLGALLDAARQGLEPGTEQYYLIPQKDKGVLKVRGQAGYQGIIELIYRAGAVSSVIVEVVRAGDGFQYRPGRDERPLHDIDWDAEDRGALRLTYAYAVMKDGATSKVVVLNRADIDRAKLSSDGASSAYSPWIKHEEAMWLKTAAKRLAKWVPTSAEYLREQLRAVAAVAAEAAPVARDGVVGDHVAATYAGQTGLEDAAVEQAPEGDLIDVSDAEVVDAEVYATYGDAPAGEEERW